MKAHWKGVLGFVLSALLIAYTLRGVDLLEVWAEVRVANFWLLSSSLAIALSGYFIRAVRWRILLDPVDPDTLFGNPKTERLQGFLRAGQAA